MVPASLVQRGIAFSPQADGDFAFLSRLYISVRWEELLQVDWPDTVKRQFLESQFSLQHKHYTTYYHRSDFLIIEQDGQRIGRLALDRGHPKDLRIVDVALLPEHRGTGIGTLLLDAILDEAATAAKKTSIHVEHNNPARRLYSRLGFVEISPQGPYLLMEAPARTRLSVS